MSCQPETPILAQGQKAWGLKWVEDWYGTWYEKCHVIRDRPFNLQGGGRGGYVFLLRSEIFFRTARESEYFLFLWCEARDFFPEFNIRLYDKNSESDYFFSSTWKLNGPSLTYIYIYNENHSTYEELLAK